jgi:hypothetical protein
MQAAQGQAFVVAASHLILRRRQPSHARMTGGRVSREVFGGFGVFGAGERTLEAFVPVVFVDEDIVCGGQVSG